MAYSGAFHLEKTPREPARQTPESLPPRGGRSAQKPDPLSGAVEALMRRLNSVEMETDDLIMALILYLMYRESGDKDLLIMLGAMLLT